jgi:hypothetical protein
LYKFGLRYIEGQTSKPLYIAIKELTMKKARLLFLICLLLAGASSYAEQTPAFPGAEGHGRYTTGGRGGTVYFVNSLEDNDPPVAGSLRHALNQSGPRTILFTVSGTIRLVKELRISNGNVTIAGQSAPGEGICLADFPVVISADNVIIRFIRCRMGDLGNANADGADVMGGRGHKNIIIDHCSMSWSTDECVSFYGNENFSLQWCIVSESLRLSEHSKGPHGYAGIWGGVNASFHHNLLAHHDSRNPRLGPYAETSGREYVDMRNNVIYNWCGNSCYGGEGMNVNIVNCYYKPGPATPGGEKRGRIISIDKKTGITEGRDFYNINNVWGKFYIEGNIVSSGVPGYGDENEINATNNNWFYGVYNQFASGYGTVSTADRQAMKMSEAFDPGVVTTHTAAKAYQKVLEFAGCSHQRDSYDARIVEETSTGQAAFIGLSPYNGLGGDWKSVNYPRAGIIDSQEDLRPNDATAGWTPWPILNSTTAPLDSDNDGMPDDWEDIRGLDPSDPADKNSLNKEGYTRLEEYLNTLVAHIITEQNQEAVSSLASPASENGFFVEAFWTGDGLYLHSDKELQQVEIFDVSGRKVLQFEGNYHAAPTLARACYLLKAICTGGETKVIRLPGW